MNQTEQLLLGAIRKSIWNTDIVFPADTDWSAVLKEAGNQAVLGIVIGTAPKEFQKEWINRASGVTARFVRILNYQEQVYQLLSGENIPMVILKGTAAAIYYTNPSQRTMGDIDFLVPEDQFDRAAQVLQESGFEVEVDPHYSRHIDVKINGVLFEMHRYFSDGDVDIERFIKDDVTNPEIKQLYGVSFPMLPKLANGMVLLGHIVHHMRSGLGLRQIIDWMMFVDKELDDVFWTETFKTAASEAGLETVAVTVTRMCQLFLGLSDRIGWCRDADPELCTELMESILDSGNFGVKNEKGVLIEKTITNLKKDGFRYLQKAGERNWEACQKHKWLKPLAWIYQIGRYLKQGLQTKRTQKQIIKDYERGNRRVELLKKLKIGQ